LLDRSGWPEFFEDGVLLTLRGKTGWREAEIGRGSSERTCPIAALEAWRKFARIARGPVVRAGVGREVGSESLNDGQVTRLRLAVTVGVRGDLSERDRAEKFSGHSLRAGLASSAEIDERYVQKDLGHVGGNDPSLPAASRPLPDQHDQRCGLVDAPRGRRPSARHRRFARPPSWLRWRGPPPLSSAISSSPLWRANSLATQARVPKIPETSAGT